jgi:oxalate decarboxylase
MPTDAKTSRHVVSLTSLQPRYSGPTGAIMHMDSSELSLLKGLSLRRLVLAPLGVREPHWHANAHEMGFCIQGRALVTIAGNDAARDAFVVEQGDLFFAPSGTMHAIQNAGDTTAEFVLAFTHEQPEDFGIKAAFGAMTDAVLGNTYDLPAAALDGFDRGKDENWIYPVTAKPAIPDDARHVNRYKYSLAATPAQIESAAGAAHIVNAALWPVLRDVTMYLVTIATKGMREPHWHPETAEMGYVITGEARMTVLDPNGTADTYVVRPGDAYFIPRAYPHHIENIGDGPLKMAIFFDTALPGDIGYRTLINIFPVDIVAAAFGMTAGSLPAFPFTASDPLLVPRSNPVDPVG